MDINPDPGSGKRLLGILHLCLFDIVCNGMDHYNHHLHLNSIESRFQSK